MEDLMVIELNSKTRELPLVGLAGTVVGILTALARVGSEPLVQTGLVAVGVSIGTVVVALVLRSLLGVVIRKNGSL
jgi:hypothetical protein